MHELLRDHALDAEMKKKRHQEGELEKANRPKAVTTTWSEFLRLQRTAYSKLEGKTSLKEFMKSCSDRYKNLSEEDRSELEARVQADTKRFEDEMEHYYRAYPQTSSSKGSKRKREQDGDQRPKRKRDQGQDQASPVQVAQSARKVKGKRARSVQPIHSDSEQSSVAENSEASV